MNFVNCLSLFAAIVSVFSGLNCWVNEFEYRTILGITPTWETFSLVMFACYWGNISVLAYQLQKCPPEWIGGTLVQRGVKDSVNEMLRENLDNQLLKQDKKWKECEDTVHVMYNGVSKELVEKGLIPKQVKK